MISPSPHQPVRVDPPGEVGADVVAAPLDALQDRVRHLGRQRPATPPLGVQVAVLGVVLTDLVRHLVVDRDRHLGGVLDREVGAGPERHRPVGVEAAVRVGRHRLRAHLGEAAPATAEEVAVRHLHGRLVGAVPVRPQHQRAPVVGVGGDPQVGDPRPARRSRPGRTSRAARPPHSGRPSSPDRDRARRRRPCPRSRDHRHRRSRRSSPGRSIASPPAASGRGHPVPSSLTRLHDWHRYRFHPTTDPRSTDRVHTSTAAR